MKSASERRRSDVQCVIAQGALQLLDRPEPLKLAPVREQGELRDDMRGKGPKAGGNSLDDDIALCEHGYGKLSAPT